MSRVDWMGREDLEREVKRLREDNEVLRAALRVSLCDEATMRENLKSVQALCTALLEECRAIKQDVDACDGVYTDFYRARADRYEAENQTLRDALAGRTP